MFFASRCQAREMGERFFGDVAAEACDQTAEAMREGYHLCWACAESFDLIRAFAARLVAGTVDGMSEPDRSDS